MHAGWMIRYHRKTRKRAFHPLHRGKGAPTPTDLIPYRMTVQFNSQGESKFWLGQWIGQTWSSPGYLGWVLYSGARMVRAMLEVNYMEMMEFNGQL